jgi:hypothetical protein
MRDAGPRFHRVSRDFLLRVPSGKLQVGGLEDYRQRKPQPAHSDPCLEITPGNYLLRCFITSSPQGNEPQPPSDEELGEIAGQGDVRHYRQMNRLGCVLFAAPICLLPVFIHFFPLAYAFTLAGLLFAAIPTAWKQLVEQRSPRYQRVDALYGRTLQNKRDAAPPDLILALSPARDATFLSGGSIDLESWTALSRKEE